MRAHEIVCSLSRRCALALAVVLMLTLSACGGSGGGAPAPDPDPDPTPDPTPTGFALTGNTTDRWFTVESVTLNAARNFVVEFSMEDGGAPLSLTDLDSDPRFLLGWIDEDTLPGGDLRTRYQSYVVNTRNGVMHDLDGDGMSTDAPVLASATQAGTDSGGSIDVLGGGRFRFTSGTALPANYVAGATHTIALYATRGGRSDVVNPYVHFVPSGATLSTMRDIIPTSSCTACHDKLAAHGGTRNEVILCQICHTDQTIDPETGNTVDFENMVHKIHAGSSLSSIYRIVGYRETVHDYHEITWTQDVRNCTSCHKDGAQSENYRLAPGRAACGSCHDDVNFVTGFEHNAGPFSDDDACSSCHEPVKVADFDLSIPGSHAVPYTSSFNPNLTFAITAVSNMTPGNAPTVTFTATTTGGGVDITTLNRVAMLFAGPAPDYREYTSVTVSAGDGTLVDNGGGSYTFTPNAFTVPVTALGTWSVGMEGRTENIPVGGLTITNVRFGGNNPVVDVSLSTGTLTGTLARRVIVDEAQCNTCHNDVLIHGNLRTEIAYCVMCHNGWTNDEARRPGIDAVANPPESVDFRYMIHKIHAGKELANGYLVYGFGGTPHDFSDVHFPRPINQCTACHTGGTERLPIPSDAQAQVFNWGGPGNILGVDIVPTSILAPIRPPITATCLSCHDSASTAAHAIVQAVPTPLLDPNVWTEACITCHGVGREFDAEVYHK
jgi:OmcA/MtrC family decaheme c-type cytochrome